MLHIFVSVTGRMYEMKAIGAKIKRNANIAYLISIRMPPNTKTNTIGTEITFAVSTP